MFSPSNNNYSFVVYYPFIKLIFKISRLVAITEGNGVTIKIILDLITVLLMCVSSVLELINALDYIQSTRLALINYSKDVAAMLVLMSLTKCKTLSYNLKLHLYFSIVTLFQMGIIHSPVDGSH